MTADTKLIVALDFDTVEEAKELVNAAGDSVEWYKVGKQLFTRNGPAAVSFLKEAGKNVFLDLKFHDIPNTVAGAIRSAAAIGADMTNVHAGGGPAMLKAAAEAGEKSGMLTIAVTVLTSMDKAELEAVGVESEPKDQVVKLAKLAEASGLNGVVCSAHEITPLRKRCKDDFVLVVPGIRPTGSAVGDQKRVMTPAEAASAGADFIVVGRPVTKAENPAAAAAAILDEIKNG